MFLDAIDEPEDVEIAHIEVRAVQSLMNELYIKTGLHRLDVLTKGSTKRHYVRLSVLLVQKDLQTPAISADWHPGKLVFDCWQHRLHQRLSIQFLGHVDRSRHKSACTKILRILLGEYFLDERPRSDLSVKHLRWPGHFS